MKPLIFVIAAIILSSGSFAQTQSSEMNRDMTTDDGVMMLGGKMLMVKDGKMTFLVDQMTMGNGTKVMPDGKCMKKDGTKMKMKEGDHIDMAGNLRLKKVSKKPGRLVIKKNIAKSYCLSGKFSLA